MWTHLVTSTCRQDSESGVSSKPQADLQKQCVNVRVSCHL
jgi:hypothetical protein